MKTLLRNHFFIYKPLCEVTFYSRFWRSVRSLVADCLRGLLQTKTRLSPLTPWRSSSSLVRAFKTKVSIISRLKFGILTAQSAQCFVRVFKEVAAGLNALVLAASANKREYVGLVLMYVCAPFAYCAYDFCDEGARAASNWSGWEFHLNPFHLLFLIRWQLSGVIFLCGFYLNIPEGKRAKMLAIPIGFLFMSIWVNVFAGSNDDMRAIGNVYLFFAGACLALVIFYGMDWFVSRWSHRVRAFESRLDGICQVADDLPAEKVVSMFKATWREKKEFPKQY